jgi:LPXTG-site transpeptidase (sortase) family protein
MDNNNTPKNYPAAAAEISKILGLDKTTPEISQHAPESSKKAHEPSNLPVVDAHAIEPKVHTEHDTKHAGHQEAKTEQEMEEKVESVVGKVIRGLAPFILVFVIGVFLYYFFFSSIDFGNLFNRTQTVQSPKQTAIEELQKNNLDSYQKWIAQFYYDVSDPKITDPSTDNSGNGLSNFHKFLLNLNPKSYDTLGLGMADSQALALGLNPLSGTALNERQKEIVERYFDLESIMNRLSLAHASGQIAGSATSTSPFVSQNNTIPQAPRPSAFENSIDINTDIPARLEVPALNINVPIIWTKDPKNFEKDLQIGVVHYPGTALPGQIGTTYISGHSSNVPWAKGSFNHVFSKLGDLPDNSTVKVTVVQKNGKDAKLFYVVTHRKEYSPIDQEQFRNTGESTIALSTCWPVGSTAKRLVVFAKLTQMERD